MAMHFILNIWSKSFFLILLISLLKFGIAYCLAIIHHAKFGVYFQGYDELFWQQASIYFYNNGLSISTLQGAMGEFQAFNVIGWPTLISVFHYFFGPSYFNIILLKWALFLFAANALYLLLKRIHTDNLFPIIAVFFLACYYPLGAADNTFLRDDVLVYLIIIMLWASTGITLSNILWRTILLAACAYLLLFSRPMALLIYGVLNLFFFKISRPSIFIITFSIVLFLFSFIFDVFQYAINFLLTSRVSLMSLIFSAFKFYIGPLPWNMFYVDSEYEPWWYILSFPLVIISFFFKEFFLSVKANWKPLLGMFIVGFLPYLIGNQKTDLIGPRQFAMSGFFIGIIIYGSFWKLVEDKYYGGD